MNFFKRIFYSVLHNKFRTVTLIISFSVICALLLSSAMVYSISTIVNDNLRRNIAGTIKIERKSVFISGKDGDISENIGIGLEISDAYFKKVEKIPHVVLANNYKIQWLEVGNIKLRQTHSSDHGDHLYLYTVTDTSKLMQFTSGSYKLVSGRQLNISDSGQDNIMIEKTTADLNKLRVGDKIGLLNQNGDKNLNYNIVGIFTAPFYNLNKETYGNTSDPSWIMFTSDNKNSNPTITDSEFEKRNPNKEQIEKLKNTPVDKLSEYEQIVNKCILLRFELQQKGMIKPISKDDLAYGDTFYITVDDPKNLPAVIKSLRELPDSNDYALTSYNYLYNRIATPIEKVQQISQTFLVVIFFVSMVLIFIIILLSFYGRMHEFGILISVGEKKAKMILQLLGELLIPIILALVISFSVSPLIAKTAGDYIINKNYKAIDRVDLMKSRALIETNDTYNVNNIEQINNLDIDLDGNNILIFSGGLLLILIVSTAIPIVKIVKLSPMKILQKKG